MNQEVQGISIQEKGEKREVITLGHHKKTLEVAGAAIFGALSIVVSLFTTQILPRIEWGIAYFDPVSIIWITAFLLFGFRAGLLTCAIGTLGLMPFDPNPLVGPVMKFTATIWFIILPYYVGTMIIKRKPEVRDYKNLRIYLPGAFLAWIIRCIVMVGLNYLYIKYIWQVPVEYFDMGWIGHAELTGWTAIIITVALLNSIQSVFDVSIPYLIVYPTKIYLKIVSSPRAK